MSTIQTKSSLPRAYRQLLEEMQRLNFGRIEKLSIRGGLPVFDPPPRLVRDVKFAAENGPRPEIRYDDFRLKAQVRELLQSLSKMHDTTIECIEVHHGLPFRMSVEEPLAR